MIQTSGKQIQLNNLYQDPNITITDDSISSPVELLAWMDYGLEAFSDELVDRSVAYMEHTFTGRCVAIGQIIGWFGPNSERTYLTIGLVMYQADTEEHYFFILNNQTVEVEAQHLPVIKLVVFRAIKNFIIEKMKLSLPTYKTGMIWKPIANSELSLDMNVVA